MNSKSISPSLLANAYWLVMKREKSTLPLRGALKNAAVASPEGLPRYLPKRVAAYVQAKAEICQPKEVRYDTDG